MKENMSMSEDRMNSRQTSYDRHGPRARHNPTPRLRSGLARLMDGGLWRGGLRRAAAGLALTAAAVLALGGLGVDSAQAQTTCDNKDTRTSSWVSNRSTVVYNFFDFAHPAARCSFRTARLGIVYDTDSLRSGPGISVLFGKWGRTNGEMAPNLPIKVRAYPQASQPATSGVMVTCTPSGGANVAVVNNVGSTGTHTIALNAGQSCALYVGVRASTGRPAMEMTATLERLTTGNHVRMSNIILKGGNHYGGTVAAPPAPKQDVELKLVESGTSTTELTAGSNNDLKAAVGFDYFAFVRVQETAAGKKAVTSGSVSITHIDGNKLSSAIRCSALTGGPGVAPGVAECSIPKSLITEAGSLTLKAAYNPGSAAFNTETEDLSLPVRAFTTSITFVDGSGQTTNSATATAVAPFTVRVGVQAATTNRQGQRIAINVPSGAGDVTLSGTGITFTAGQGCTYDSNGIYNCTATAPATGPVTLNATFTGSKGKDTTKDYLDSTTDGQGNNGPPLTLTVVAKPKLAVSISVDQPLAVGTLASVTVTFTKPAGSSAAIDGTPVIALTGVAASTLTTNTCSSPTINRTATANTATATCTFTSSTGGDGKVEVTYSGGNNYAAISTPVTKDFTVDAANTEATFVNDVTGASVTAAAQATIGQSLNLFVKIVSVSTVPSLPLSSGRVTLQDQAGNPIAGFTCSRPNTNTGIFTCTIANVPANLPTTIYAAYSPQNLNNYNEITGNERPQRSVSLSKSTLAVSIDVQPQPVAVKQVATVTVTFTKPTGVVAAIDGTPAIVLTGTAAAAPTANTCSSPTINRTATANTATATCTFTSSTGGDGKVEVTYSGGNNYAAISTPVTEDFTVAPAKEDVELVLVESGTSSTELTAGSNENLKATVGFEYEAFVRVQQTTGNAAVTEGSVSITHIGGNRLTQAINCDALTGVRNVDDGIASCTIPSARITETGTLVLRATYDPAQGSNFNAAGPTDLSLPVRASATSIEFVDSTTNHPTNTAPATAGAPFTVRVVVSARTTGRGGIGRITDLQSGAGDVTLSGTGITFAAGQGCTHVSDGIYNCTATAPATAGNVTLNATFTGSDGGDGVQEYLNSATDTDGTTPSGPPLTLTVNPAAKTATTATFVANDAGAALSSPPGGNPQLQPHAGTNYRIYVKVAEQNAATTAVTRGTVKVTKIANVDKDISCGPLNSRGISTCEIPYTDFGSSDGNKAIEVAFAATATHAEATATQTYNVIAPVATPDVEIVSIKRQTPTGQYVSGGTAEVTFVLSFNQPVSIAAGAFGSGNAAVSNNIANFDGTSSGSDNRASVRFALTGRAGDLHLNIADRTKITARSDANKQLTVKSITDLGNPGAGNSFYQIYTIDITAPTIDTVQFFRVQSGPPTATTSANPGDRIRMLVTFSEDMQASPLPTVTLPTNNPTQNGFAAITLARVAGVPEQFFADFTVPSGIAADDYVFTVTANGALDRAGNRATGQETATLTVNSAAAAKEDVELKLVESGTSAKELATGSDDRFKAAVGLGYTAYVRVQETAAGKKAVTEGSVSITEIGGNPITPAITCTDLTGVGGVNDGIARCVIPSARITEAGTLVLKATYTPAAASNFNAAGPTDLSLPVRATTTYIEFVDSTVGAVQRATGATATAGKEFTVHVRVYARARSRSGFSASLVPSGAGNVTLSGNGITFAPGQGCTYVRFGIYTCTATAPATGPVTLNATFTGDDGKDTTQDYQDSSTDGQGNNGPPLTLTVNSAAAAKTDVELVLVESGTSTAPLTGNSNNDLKAAVGFDYTAYVRVQQTTTGNAAVTSGTVSITHIGGNRLTQAINCDALTGVTGVDDGIAGCLIPEGRITEAGTLVLKAAYNPGTAAFEAKTEDLDLLVRALTTSIEFWDNGQIDSATATAGAPFTVRVRVRARTTSRSGGVIITSVPSGAGDVTLRGNGITFTTGQGCTYDSNGIYNCTATAPATAWDVTLNATFTGKVGKDTTKDYTDSETDTDDNTPSGPPLTLTVDPAAKTATTATFVANDTGAALSSPPGGNPGLRPHAGTNYRIYVKVAEQNAPGNAVTRGTVKVTKIANVDKNISCGPPNSRGISTCEIPYTDFGSSDGNKAIEVAFAATATHAKATATQTYNVIAPTPAPAANAVELVLVTGPNDPTPLDTNTLANQATVGSFYTAYVRVQETAAGKKGVAGGNLSVSVDITGLNQIIRQRLGGTGLGCSSAAGNGAGIYTCSVPGRFIIDEARPDLILTANYTAARGSGYSDAGPTTLTIPIKAATPTKTDVELKLVESGTSSTELTAGSNDRFKATVGFSYAAFVRVQQTTTGKAAVTEGSVSITEIGGNPITPAITCSALTGVRDVDDGIARCFILEDRITEAGTLVLKATYTPAAASNFNAAGPTDLSLPVRASATSIQFWDTSQRQQATGASAAAGREFTVSVRVLARTTFSNGAPRVTTVLSGAGDVTLTGIGSSPIDCTYDNNIVGIYNCTATAPATGPVTLNATFTGSDGGDGVQEYLNSATDTDFSTPNGPPLTLTVADAPRITKIERQTPPNERTNAASITWLVTFSANVDIDANAFGLIQGSTRVAQTPTTPAVTNVNTVRVTATTIDNREGDVTLTVDLNAVSLASASSVKLASARPNPYEKYTVDRVAPTYTTSPGSVAPGATITFTLDFNEDMQASPLPTITTSTAGVQVGTVSHGGPGDADKFTAQITVPDSFSGTSLALAIGNLNDVKDLAGNPASQTPAARTVTLTVAPMTVTSVEVTTSGTPSNQPQIGDTVTITATVKAGSASGPAVNGVGRVTFAFSNTGQATNQGLNAPTCIGLTNNAGTPDASGEVRCTYTVQNTGAYSVVATFTDATGSRAGSNSGTAKPIPAATKIAYAVQANDITVSRDPTVGKEVIVTFAPKKPTGAPTDAPDPNPSAVTIVVKQGNAPIACDPSSAVGECKFTPKAAGPYTVEVTGFTDPAYEFGSSAPQSFTVARASTQIAFEATPSIPKRVAQNGRLVFKVKVTIDGPTTPLPNGHGGAVKATLGGQEVTCTEDTASSGIFTCTFSPGAFNGLTQQQGYKLKAEYEAPANYDKSTTPSAQEPEITIVAPAANPTVAVTVDYDASTPDVVDTAPPTLSATNKNIEVIATIRGTSAVPMQQTDGTVKFTGLPTGATIVSGGGNCNGVGLVQAAAGTPTEFKASCVFTPVAGTLAGTYKVTAEFVPNPAANPAKFNSASDTVDVVLNAGKPTVNNAPQNNRLVFKANPAQGNNPPQGEVPFDDANFGAPQAGAGGRLGKVTFDVVDKNGKPPQGPGPGPNGGWSNIPHNQQPAARALLRPGVYRFTMKIPQSAPGGQASQQGRTPAPQPFTQDFTVQIVAPATQAATQPAATKGKIVVQLDTNGGGDGLQAHAFTATPALGTLGTGFTLTTTKTQTSDSKDSGDLDPNTYTITATDFAGTDYSLSDIGCIVTGTGSRGSTTTPTASDRKVEVVLNANDIVTCVFSAAYAPKASVATAEKTRQMVTDYLGDRNAMLLAHGVDMDSRLNRLRQGGRSGQVGGTLSVNLGQSQDATASAFSMDLRTSLPGDVSVTDDAITFAASTSRLRQTGLFGADIGDDDDIMSGDIGDVSEASGTPQMRWDVWIEGRIARFDSRNNKDGRFGVVYLGADYLITPDVLIGLMAQYDWLKKDYDTNGHVKGQGWMVGPYAALRFGEALYLDVQARAGRSSNDITPVGTYTDKFKTTRWFVSGKLSGDFDYGDWTIRPGIKVQYIGEKQKAYTDSLGNRIAAQTVSEGDVRAGPRIAYTYNLADGGTLIPWAEFEGVYTFGSKGKFSKGTYASDIHGLSGSIEAGFDWRMPAGAMFSLSGSYDGIGSGSKSYGARARIDIPF